MSGAGLRRLVVCAVAAAGLPLGLVASPAAAADEGVLVLWSVPQDDGAHFTASVRIRNLTPAVLNDWQVTLPFPHDITEVTGAVSVQDGQTLTLSGGAGLLPGHTRTVTLSVASAAPDARTPQTCTAEAVFCTVVVESSEPSSSPTASPSASAVPLPVPDRSSDADPAPPPVPAAPIPLIPWSAWRL